MSVVEPSRPSADRAHRTRSGRAAETADLEPFAVEIQRRQGVTIVKPRGELELATVEPLRSALDEAIAETLSAALGGMEHEARLVLDLRGLSFIDSTGVHLLVTLDQRAQRDGFQLTLLAPAAPVDRAIQLCGLDRLLPFAAPVDAVDTQPGEPSPADRASEALRDVS
jgi:anti-sigma B factor antagonist